MKMFYKIHLQFTAWLISTKTNAHIYTNKKKNTNLEQINFHDKLNSLSPRKQQ